MSVDERVRKIIAKILKADEDMIKEDTAIGGIPGWDSLNQMRILSVIESELGIQFSADVMLEMENFSDIVRAVEEQTAR